MAGIYIHIPFCKQACSYCDFHFSTSFESYRDQMVGSIQLELRTRAVELEGQEIGSIYFGGGTPSLLRKDELNEIIQTVYDCYRVDREVEITLETNPDDFTRESVEEWINAGINRLSIGIQSFRDSDLKWMNRAHNAVEAQNAIHLAKNAGFEKLTIDLIYGLPDLKLEDWRTQLNAFFELDVDHLSAYCLTIEDKTALSKWLEQGKMNVPKEQDQIEQFRLLVELMEEKGYEHYEISNFARLRKRSKHNSAYWSGAHFIGVGPSAHSYNGTSRRWNVSNNAKYIKAVQSHSCYWESEALSSQDRFNELLLTGLRKIEGLSLKELNEIVSLDDIFNSRLNDFIEADWVQLKGEQIRLSVEGKLRADFIASELFIV